MNYQILIQSYELPSNGEKVDTIRIIKRDTLNINPLFFHHKTYLCMMC